MRGGSLVETLRRNFGEGGAGILSLDPLECASVEPQLIERGFESVAESEVGGLVSLPGFIRGELGGGAVPGIQKAPVQVGKSPAPDELNVDPLVRHDWELWPGKVLLKLRCDRATSPVTPDGKSDQRGRFAFPTAGQPPQRYQMGVAISIAPSCVLYRGSRQIIPVAGLEPELDSTVQQNQRPGQLNARGPAANDQGLSPDPVGDRDGR